MTTELTVGLRYAYYQPRNAPTKSEAHIDKVWRCQDDRSLSRPVLNLGEFETYGALGKWMPPRSAL